MSQYIFDWMIVFMFIIGEEQGLFGVEVFVDYIDNNDFLLWVVYNNDVIGGIICGEMVFFFGCLGFNVIDSINV